MSSKLKIEFKNPRLNKDNLVKEWEDFYEMMQQDVSSYYAQQARANAPTLQGKDILAESIFTTEFKEKTGSVIHADNSSAFEIHENTGKYHENPKSQKSQTGGIGPKYIERAMYNSVSIVKAHYAKSIKRFFEGKPYQNLTEGNPSQYIKED